MKKLSGNSSWDFEYVVDTSEPYRKYLDEFCKPELMFCPNVQGITVLCFPLVVADVEAW